MVKQQFTAKQGNILLAFCTINAETVTDGVDAHHCPVSHDPKFRERAEVQQTAQSQTCQCPRYQELSGRQLGNGLIQQLVA